MSDKTQALRAAQTAEFFAETQPIAETAVDVGASEPLTAAPVADPVPDKPKKGARPKRATA